MNNFKGIEEGWILVPNTSWGEDHKQNFGDKEGFVICYSKNGELKAIASVIGISGEKQEVIKANGKLIEAAPKMFQMLQRIAFDEFVDLEEAKQLLTKITTDESE